jgi:hypothetical protein
LCNESTSLKLQNFDENGQRGPGERFFVSRFYDFREQAQRKDYHHNSRVEFSKNLNKNDYRR